MVRAAVRAPQDDIEDACATAWVAFLRHQPDRDRYGVLAIPPHDEGAVLTVSEGLRVEQIFFDGSTGPETAASLLHVQRRDGDLPLRGTAVGWCKAGLTLHRGRQRAHGVRV